MPKLPERFPFDVFLSHSSKDKPYVKPLALLLRDQEGLRAWYDEWNLQPGLPWQEALETGLAESASVTVFIGAGKLGPWHNEELREAINRSVSQNDGFRVIPVLLPGADPESLPSFLKRRMWVDFRSGIDDELAYKKLTAAIRGEAFEEAAFSLPEEMKPYQGLAPYQSSDAQFFFGRETQIGELTQMVKDSKLVLLSGASGVGKTSLLQAGLIPALKLDPETQSWRIRLLRPGSDPFQNLANLAISLDPNLKNGLDQMEHSKELAHRLNKEPNALRNAISAFAHVWEKPVLIVIDQFEEFFFLPQISFPENHAQIVADYIDNLVDTVEMSDGKIRIILSVRSDYLDEMNSFPELASLVSGKKQLPLKTPEKEDLLKFVQQSAYISGAMFEKGLVNSLLREVENQACKYSLLQVELVKLWDGRKGSWLTVDAFESGGGLKSSFLGRADKLVDKLKERNLVSLLEQILIRLIKPGEGLHDQRRKANRNDFSDSEHLDWLVRELTGPEFRLAEAHNNEVILAHDGLVREWKTARDFLGEYRPLLRMISRVMESSKNWENNDNNSDFLFKGAQLMEFEELKENSWVQNISQTTLPARELKFIKASIMERYRLKNRKRITTGVLVGSLVLVLAVFLTLFIKVRKEKQESEANKAVSLAISAAELYAAQPTLAFNLAEESIRLFPDSVKNRTAYDALLNSYFHSPFNFTLKGHKQGIHGGELLVSPDGKYLLTNLKDQKAILWTSQGKFVREFEHKDHINHIAFSPDSIHLLTASADSTCKVWKLNGDLVQQWNVGAPVIKAVFSPQGKEVLTLTGVQVLNDPRDKLGATIWRLGQIDSIFHHEFSNFQQGPHQIDLNFSFGKKHFVFELDFSREEEEDFCVLFNLEGKVARIIDPALNPLFRQSSDWKYSVVYFTENRQKQIRIYDHTTGKFKPKRIFLDDFNLKEFNFSSDNLHLILHPEPGYEDRIYEVETSQEIFFPKNLARKWSSPKLENWAKGINFYKDENNYISTRIADIKEGIVFVRSDYISNGNVIWSSIGLNPIDLSDFTAFELPNKQMIGEFSQIGNCVFLSPAKNADLYVFSSDGSLIYYLKQDKEAPSADPSRSIALSGSALYLYRVLVDGHIDVWPISSESNMNIFQKTGIVSAFSLSPDGKEVAIGNYPGHVQVFQWHGPIGTQIGGLKSNSDDILAVAHSSIGQRPLAWAKKDEVFLLRENSEQPIALQAKGTISLAFSPDGTSLLTASPTALYIWGTDGSLKRKILTSTNLKTAIFSPDGYKILGTGPEGVFAWDINGEESFRITEFGPLTKPLFSSQGKYFTATSNQYRHGQTYIFDQDGKMLQVLKGHIALSKKTELVLKCDKTGSNIGEIASLKAIINDDFDPRFAVVSPGSIVKMGFSPDETWIYITNPDHRLFLYRMGESRPSYVIPLGAPLSQITFSPDGRFFYTLSWGGVKYWPLDPGYFLRTARRANPGYGFIQKMEFSEKDLR